MTPQQPADGAAPKLDAHARCLRLGEREVPLYSGAVHYFRHPRSRWSAILEGLRATGLGMVETYVPWSVHEVSQGQFDFGQIDPTLDLGAFLDLASELELLVFLRPGPHINAELTHFGIPERVLLDPACQARSADGLPLPLPAPPQMFPVPSCASHTFRVETQKWFDAMAQVVAPRIWPAGPVVLLQVDNEAAYYFRDGPFDGDHHPDALQSYRSFLRARYGELNAAAAAHGIASPGDWDSLLPPARFEPPEHPGGLRRYIDWAAFRAWLLLDSVGVQAQALADAGLGALPTVHNAPMGDAGLPYTLAEMDQRVDVTGLDYYETARSLQRVKRRTLRLAGSVRLPHAPELGVGVPPWFGLRTADDALQVALCALAHGLRGFNLYMAADRDRWWGAVLDSGGGKGPRADTWRKLVRALQRLEFHGLQRQAEVVLSLPREYARLSQVTHTLGAASPSVLALATGNPTAACRAEQFGLQDAVQRAWWPLLENVASALTRAGVPYVYVDSDAPLPQHTRLVVAPMYEFAERARLEQLASFEARGGAVVYGPRTARLDGAMSPMEDAPPLSSAPELDGDAEALTTRVNALIAKLGLEAGPRVAPAPLELCVHTDDAGKPRVLFIINPGAGQAHARVTLAGNPPLVDVLSGAHFTLAGTGGIEMKAHSVRMLEVRFPKPSARKRRTGARRGGGQ